MTMQRNTGLIISGCLILMTAGLVGSGIFQIVLILIAAMIGGILAYDALR